jgi:hypothetical protein
VVVVVASSVEVGAIVNLVTGTVVVILLSYSSKC